MNANLNNAISNIDKLRDPLSKLINEIDNMGANKTATKGGVPNGKLTSVLNNRLQGLRDIARTIKILADDLAKMANTDIPAAIKNIDDIQQPLSDLITKVGSVGARQSGQNGSGVNTKNITVLNSNLQGIRDIARTIKILGEDLKQFYHVKTVVGKLKGVGTALVSFMQEFSQSNPKVAGDLKTGIDNSKKISTILRRYATIIVDLNNISDIDAVTGKFKTFIDNISGAVSTKSLTKLEKANVNKLSSIASAFKNLFAAMKAINGGSFTNFTKNVQAALPDLEDFIDKMAALTKRATFADFERVANAMNAFKGKTHDASDAVNRLDKNMISLKSTMRQIYTALVGGSVIYSIVRAIKDAVKNVYELEYAMARVNTIARVSNSTLKTMTHFVQDMSAQYGIASDKVAKALYDINSATIKGTASMKILEQSMRLAVAGFADIEKVTDLIAKAVNAYEYSASEAAKISDILFVTVERGINPMEELSEYMGRMFTVAANAGVSLEEVGAGLATLTARGYQTNVASTALNSAILKLSTGTKELNKLFREYGYASSASALRTVGLTGALQVLYKATNGATEKLHDLGFNYRDIRAATTLASGAINEYNKTLALMNDETYKNGLTSKSLAEVQDTVKFKFNQLKQTFVVFIQTVAESLNKNKLLKESLETLTHTLENLSRQMQGATLTFKEQFSSDVVTLIPKLVALYGVFNLLRKAILGVGSAFGFSAASGSKFLAGLSSAGGTVAGLFAVSTVWNIGSNIEEIIEAGTWVDGIKLAFKETLEGEGFWEKLGGLWRDTTFLQYAGWENLLNVLGIHTDAYQKLRPADIQVDVAEEFKKAIAPEYVKLSEAIKDQVFAFKLFDIKELGYSEENIIAAYDKYREQILSVADSLGITEEGFKKEFGSDMLKSLNEQRDALLKLNKQYLALNPNVKIFRDTFENASKNIKDNIEKFADPLQKTALDFIKVQDALNVITKEVGSKFSLDAIKSAFSSSENLAEFKKNLEDSGLVLSEEFNNAVLVLSELLPKTTKEIDKMTKSFVKLGLDMRKLQAQQISLDDIVSNVFGLSGVTAVKDELRSLLSSPSNVIGEGALNSLIKTTLEDIDAMKPLNEIQADLMKINPNLTPEQVSTIYKRVQEIIGFTGDFVNQLSQTDFMKTMNKMLFGGELSAFKQYEQFDKKAIDDLMARDINGKSFREILQYAQMFGLNKARIEFGAERSQLFIESFKENQGLFSSSSALMTETKNIKKKIHTFLKNYEDAFLTPIQKFEKTGSIMQKQLAKIKKRLSEGKNISPLDASRYLENIEKMQKLNEDMMTMKVPSSITASEAVRTGSKEAFDLVATNIFRDMYKVNVQQKNLQKELVDQAKNLNKYLTNSNNILRVVAPY